MKRIIFILLVLSFASSVMAQSPEFKAMIDQTIAHTVPTISVDSLNKNAKKYTILDAREANEYAVSHINNAIFVGYNNFDFNKIKSKLNKKKPIVIYCSIGYRSEKIADALKAQGYEVYNLYGGIFEWKNQGYAVIDVNNKPTENVHAFDPYWGKWLLKGKKIFN